jgi:hypothetical protein
MQSGRAGAQEYGVAGSPFAGVVFSASNRFLDNHYVLADMQSRWFEWAGGPVTIEQWRATGQDTGSTFSMQ